MTSSGRPETSPVWMSYTWALWKDSKSEDQTNSINGIWVWRLISTDILMQMTLCFEDESFRLRMNFQPISLANHVVFLVCPDGKGICGNTTFRTFVWATKPPKEPKKKKKTVIQLWFHQTFIKTDQIYTIFFYKFSYKIWFLSLHSSLQMRAAALDYLKHLSMLKEADNHFSEYIIWYSTQVSSKYFLKSIKNQQEQTLTRMKMS